MEPVGTLIEDNPYHFPVVQAATEGLEPGDVLPDGFGHLPRPAARGPLAIGGQQPQHALLAEAAYEGADRVRVRVCVLGALGRRALFKEDKGADQFVAPLDLIPEM